MNEHKFPPNTVLWIRNATDDTLIGIFGLELFNTFKLVYSKLTAENEVIEQFQMFIWKTLQNMSNENLGDISIISTKIINQIRFLWKLEKHFHEKIVLQITKPEEVTSHELINLSNFLRIKHSLPLIHKNYNQIYKNIIDETATSFNLKFNSKPPIIVKNRQIDQNDENKK